MSSLWVRRLVVGAISLALGCIISYVIIVFGFPALNRNATGMTIERYGMGYFLVTMIPLALVVLIWLDKFMGTKIVPD